VGFVIDMSLQKFIITGLRKQENPRLLVNLLLRNTKPPPSYSHWDDPSVYYGGTLSRLMKEGTPLHIQATREQADCLGECFIMMPKPPRETITTLELKKFINSQVIELEGLPKEIRMEVRDSMLRGQIVELWTYVWGQDKTVSVDTKATNYVGLWDHIVDRFAPQWYKKHWPPKMEKIICDFNIQAVYPDLKIANIQPYLRVTTNDMHRELQRL
jgi:hypothetical protein